MKSKILSLVSLLLTAVATLSLTSCDKDYEEAAYLDGIWHGRIAQRYYSEWYGVGSYEEWETEIQFYHNDVTHGGRGRELDYNIYYDTYNLSEFSWTVKYGNIYIQYDDGTDIVIADYSMAHGYFTGVFYDPIEREDIATFRLEKLSSWYDYDYWYNDYYSKSHPQISSEEE